MAGNCLAYTAADLEAMPQAPRLTIPGATPGNRWTCVGPETLLIGIGNSGRRDDGLGWAFLDRVQLEMAFPGRLEYRYQLQIEDAELISRAEHVVFVDSYQGNLPGGFQWKPCTAIADVEFTTHVLPPGAILYLCQDLYGKSPQADLMLIGGQSWDLQTGLSPTAELNLDSALRFFYDSPR